MDGWTRKEIDAIMIDGIKIDVMQIDALKIDATKMNATKTNAKRNRHDNDRRKLTNRPFRIFAPNSFANEDSRSQKICFSRFHSTKHI